MADNTFTGLVNSNWGTAGNWSTLAVPTASDGNVAKFDGTSPNCTVDTSSRVCNAIDFTGYTNTITMTNQITVSGNVTLDSGMGIAGAGALITNATATLTSNGKTWPNTLSLSGSSLTWTLADVWDISGTLSIGNGGSGTVTVNGNGFTVSGSFTHNSSSGEILGTSTITLDGTGTLTGSTGSGYISTPFTINTAGTITVSGNVKFLTTTVTYTAGTVDASSGSLTISGTTTVNLDGITWENVSLTPITGGTTLTNTGTVTATTLLTVGNGSDSYTVNGGVFVTTGGLRHAGTSGQIIGTSEFHCTGTGTLDSPSATTSRIGNAMLFDTSGTLTISDQFNVAMANLDYQSGTIITNAGTWTAVGGGGGGGGQRVIGA